MSEDRVWQRSIALFDRLLECVDPAIVLESELDPAVRHEAARLWKHHVSAAREGFLERTVEFKVLPVFAPGQVLLDRFHVERMLGQGGLGEVYLARDNKTAATVALKTISRLLAPSESLRRRFVAEVRNAQRILHPNVCRIYDLLEDGRTVLLVMEYVEGDPLDTLLAARRISRQQGVEIAAQLAGGLFAAHQGGVVHGDLKPAKILVDGREPLRAVILDFGLARAVLRHAPPARADYLHARTVEYIAPELFAGAPATIASDIYAFGRLAQHLEPAHGIWEDCTQNDPALRPASLDTIIRRLRDTPYR